MKITFYKWHRSQDKFSNVNDSEDSLKRYPNGSQPGCYTTNNTRTYKQKKIIIKRDKKSYFFIKANCFVSTKIHQIHGKFSISKSFYFEHVNIINQINMEKERKRGERQNNLPRNIGDAFHECAEPWPKNCPNAISSKTIGSPTSNNIIMYGTKNVMPWCSNSRGNLTTLA